MLKGVPKTAAAAASIRSSINNRRGPELEDQMLHPIPNRKFAAMLPRLFSNPLAKRTHLFLGFAPDWYLEKNPDVRKAGVDAANHYVKHGWKEGRDPSPMFSTNYYLQQNNIDRSVIEDPLSHYFKVGRKKSLPIHPDVEDIRISD